ncbi:carboxypeptidase regulatory-like domain-containing protein [Aurantimicrobium minutum]|uniref:carboxypeptidase regulatory-like domain-containing protein n=1 Tax=Aurantimicrobium minutum TaxID=708131 RepID=UPI0024771B83|nr:carboxypeptidase regulatory-like domain-containing protein [Aurantimicrobium minutum]MDH6238666.1 protocatechuate 3,4-dioxygenase beta subunit [Aurantimicrobium minutum]
MNLQTRTFETSFFAGRLALPKLLVLLIAFTMLLSPQLVMPAYASGTGQITVSINSGPPNSNVDVSVGGSSQTVTTDGSGTASAVFTGLSDGSYYPVAYVSSGGHHTYAPTVNWSPTIIDTNNQTVTRNITLRPVFTVVASISGIPSGTQSLSTQVNSVGMGSYGSSVSPVSNPGTTENVTIEDLPAGTWNLVFASDGSASANIQVTVGSSAVTSVSASLIPTSQLSGVVRDNSGAPISGVSVTLNTGCSGNMCTSTTDSQGQYVISGINSNTFQINLSKTIGTTDISSYRSVTLAGSSLDLIMGIGSASVTGTVRSEATNNPLVPGARISGSQNAMNGLSFSTIAASDGTYTISGLDAGSFSLNANKTDSQTFQNLFIYSNANLVISAGQSRTKDFYLTPVPTGSNALSGQVTSQNGNAPLGGAWINLSDYSSGVSRSATTDGSGNYSISNLPSGTYWVNVNSSDFQYQSRRVVISGNATENFSLTPMTVGNKTVSGTVVDSRVNSPVQGAQIHIWGSGRYYSATSSANGSWSVGGVADGNYVVNVNPPQNQATVYETPLVPDISVQGSNVVRNIELRSVVAGTGRIYGILKNNVTHEPISGASMSASLSWAGGYNIEPVVTNSRGEFSFGSLPAGTYTIWAEKDGFVEIKLTNPEEDAEMGSGGGGPLVGEVDLLEGEQAYLAAKLAPVVTGNASITGTLKTSSGRLLSDEWLSLEDSRGQWSGSVITDENGIFNFANLSPGSYFINGLVQGLGSTQQKVTVTNSSVSQDVIIRPLGYITGRVLDQSGNSVPCAVVSAYRKNVDGTRGSLVSADQAQYSSANGVGSGAYSLSVPDGNYFLRVSQNCWNNSEKVIVDFASAFWSSSSASGTDLPTSEILVQAGQTVDGKNFTVSANGGQITGTVVAKTSFGTAPLSQGKFVTITVYKNVAGTYQPQGFLSKWTSGRQNGEFSINGLPAGTYKLKISDPSNSTRGFETQYVGGTSLSDAEVFTITAGRRIHIGQNELVNKVPTGDPSSVDSSQLTPSTQDMIEAPSTVQSNQTITVDVGQDMAGEWVSVWAHSTPTSLGDWVQVGADGTVTATVSEALPAGQHRIVVQDIDNKVVGWTGTTVAASVQGSPSTGGLARKSVSSVSNIGTAAPGLESPVLVSPKRPTNTKSSVGQEAESSELLQSDQPNLWIFGGLAALLAAGLVGGVWLIRSRKS